MPGSVSPIFHLSLAEQLRIIGCDDVVLFSNLLFEHRQNLHFWICRARTGEVLKVSELFGEVQQHTDKAPALNGAQKVLALQLHIGDPLSLITGEDSR